jgi:hypothetical protein
MVTGYDNTLRAQDKDWALIERQIGSVLQTLYGPVVCEPLPDSIAVLIERIAVRCGRCGAANMIGTRR